MAESGILDTVSSQEQSAAMRAFNPQSASLEILEKLDSREKQILQERFGLVSGETQTLEVVGQKMSLTRERVRQIESEAKTKLTQVPLSASFSAGVDIVHKIIEERGNIAPETHIIQAVISANDTEVNRNGIMFLLEVMPRFHLHKESAVFYRAWSIVGLDQELFKKTIDQVIEIFKQAKKTQTVEHLYETLSEKADEFSALTVDFLESYITISKQISQNPFGEWGLAEWSDIRPKDVGDKAFLVLLHHRQPEHYGKITELINKQEFDGRLAHKETVHNELIKDERFVLVGRGIYALKQWGYKSGVVADIIDSVLENAGQPLTKDQIIAEVLKQRIVKKNTIIVGLSNRKRFVKTPENRYIKA